MSTNFQEGTQNNTNTKQSVSIEFLKENDPTPRTCQRKEERNNLGRHHSRHYFYIIRSVPIPVYNLLPADPPAHHHTPPIINPAPNPP